MFSFSSIFSKFTAALFIRWGDIATSLQLVFIFSGLHFLHSKQFTVSVGPYCSSSNIGRRRVEYRKIIIHKWTEVKETNSKLQSVWFSHWLLSSWFFFTFDIYFHILHGMFTLYINTYIVYHIYRDIYCTYGVLVQLWYTEIHVINYIIFLSCTWSDICVSDLLWAHVVNDKEMQLLEPPNRQNCTIFSDYLFRHMCFLSLCLCLYVGFFVLVFVF